MLFLPECVQMMYEVTSTLISSLVPELCPFLTPEQDTLFLLGALIALLLLLNAKLRVSYVLLRREFINFPQAYVVLSRLVV